MRKSKKIVSLIVAVSMVLTVPINAFAATDENIPNSSESYRSDRSLIDLWLEGKSSFELVRVTEDNRNFVSRFSVDDVTYQIEETLNDDYSKVSSKFYKLVENEKTYLGEQKTFINRNEENIKITIEENGEIVDVQNFNNQIYIPQDENLAETNEESLRTARATEYRWFSQGKYNGSNKIYKYTVAAIVGALSGAAGGAAAGGLAAVASMIISEEWDTVYWTRETWNYMKRTPNSPIGIEWIDAGKYKYYTEYFSDRNRKNLIGTSSYIDG